MSEKLPAVKPKKLIRVLRQIGFEIDHQTGSHVILFRSSDRRRVVVPMHSRDLGIGLLAKIIADAGLTKEQFKDLL
jgi:predicted RNA binding protein YcfA (HicA-like mRNA interferase family)